MSGNKARSKPFASDTKVEDINLEISQEYINELFSSLMSISLEMYKQDSKAFAYAGMNPERILTVLIARCMKHYGHASAALARPQMQSDMRMIISYYVTRGARLSEKNLTRTNAEGKEKILLLKRVYQIKENAPNGSDDVTIARIVAVFPQVVAHCLHNGIGRIVGDKIKGLPIAYHFPGAAAIIPHESEEMYDLWIEYSISFNKVARRILPNGEREPFDPEAARANAIRYGEIMNDSEWISEEARVKLYSVFATKTH